MECGLLDQPSLSAMACQLLRLKLCDVVELSFKYLGDTSVKCASRVTKQRAIGCVLHQRVLEQIGRMRWMTLPEQQTGINETIDGGLEFRFRLVRYSPLTKSERTLVQSPLRFARPL